MSTSIINDITINTYTTDLHTESGYHRDVDFINIKYKGRELYDHYNNTSDLKKLHNNHINIMQLVYNMLKDTIYFTNLNFSYDNEYNMLVVSIKDNDSYYSITSNNYDDVKLFVSKYMLSFN